MDGKCRPFPNSSKIPNWGRSSIGKIFPFGARLDKYKYDKNN